MNSEHLFILSLLKSKNIRNVISYFDSKELKTDEAIKHYEYIKDFYKKHLSVPEISTFENKFGKLDFPQEIECEKFYADSIIEQNNKEKMLLLLKKSSEKIIQNHDTKTIHEFLLNHLKKIKVDNQEMFTGNIGTDIEKRIQRYLDIKNNEVVKYKWGYAQKDKISYLDLECPLVPGRIGIVQARPGVGKTFLICATAGHLALQGYKVLFISKEMEVEEVSERIDALMSGTSYSRLKKGMLSDEEFEKHVKYLKSIEGKVNLEVVNPKVCTQATIEKLIDQNRPDIVFIDYLQLLKDNSSKESEKRHQIANIINDVKIFAQIFKIPIILISATNRASLESDKGPGLENIAESDVASYAIDYAFSLYQSEEQKMLNVMNLKCVKNRHGKEVNIKLSWDIDSSVIFEVN
jgi:predicted ATP-dependent serine protease